MSESLLNIPADRRGGDVELDFPAKVAEPCAAPPGLAEALGTTPHWVGRNKFDYLVELESDAAVRNLKPDFAQLATLPVRGVIVTARSDTAGADFVSRFFAPQSGVAEDPVTGSAHCALGPFWRDRLGRADRGLALLFSRFRGPVGCGHRRVFGHRTSNVASHGARGCALSRRRPHRGERGRDRRLDQRGRWPGHRDRRRRHRGGRCRRDGPGR